ncbi:hypothetical protein [Hydrogenophaga electricum]|uniref:Fungal lipase-like domain-containing protein n=1 Tax=Hydrogenophaga electricum TaxID=1230953 RepID=A0ABQ6C0G4_9BURK|nr:hypothetical protein [Hydrogenophaga electricum]GLS13350.1 hypothetical protein GCM10007935_07790 [Hydrogenophaga electricum]
MIDVAKSYINGLLADSTYVNVTPGMDRDQLIEALTARMTPTLAAFIADNFEVASSINTPEIPLLGSGFDATVWKGRDGTPYAGQVFVSTRGTEPPWVDIWGADVDLAINVAARTQIIDMVNWWLRETTPAGIQAQQIKWDPLREKPGTIGMVEPGVVLADSVAGTGNLVGVTSVQVNGHSLGGHLASSFARIFGGDNSAVGSVRVESIETFNSAGFNGDNAEFFFAQIQGLLGTGLTSFDGVEAKQTNFFAENGIEVTTNTWWFEQMGERIALSQEQGLGTANHSMYRLTDLLALGAALEKLDSTLTIDKLNEMVKTGSNDPAGSLEGVLDALRLMLDPNAERLPVSDAGDSDVARKTYHETLAAWQQSGLFANLAGHLTLTPTTEIANLQSQSKTDFGAFLALYTLSPVVISTTDAGALAALKAIQGDLAVDWQADMNARLYGDTAYEYAFSEQWYADRAGMLAVLMVRNENDLEHEVLQGSGTPVTYRDLGSDTQVGVFLGWGVEILNKQWGEISANAEIYREAA